MKELEVISRLCKLGYLECGREDEYMSKLKCVKLPWCGVVCEERCDSIVRNEGLYTQCEGKREEGGKCKRCKMGNVRDTVYERLKVGIMEYRDSEGRGPIHYSKIMKKYGVSKEEVLLEGRINGIEVDEIHFEMSEGKRGRRRKEKVEKEMSVEKKKRGRPRKEKKENGIAGEELIASLLMGNEEEKELNEVMEEETIVEKFEKNGKRYLKSRENVVYDIESHEAIGIWNENTEEIEEIEVEDE